MILTRMPTADILEREQHWVCPNCTETAVTYRLNHQRFHHCRGLFGLWCPLVEDGAKVKIIAVDREDWVGKEDVQLDGRGRPVMAVDIERENGNDRVVYAPCAHGKLER